MSSLGRITHATYEYSITQGNQTILNATNKRARAILFIFTSFMYCSEKVYAYEYICILTLTTVVSVKIYTSLLST